MDNEALVAESNIIERTNTHLTADQHVMLTELLKPGAQIEAVIPPDILPSEMWQILEACAHGLNLLDARIKRLTPIIGQILVRFENQPSLYKDLGYQSFWEFLNKGVYDQLGLHKTAAYEALKLAKNWPQVTADRYVLIGPKNMNILHKSHVNGKSPNAEILLKAAETMKVGEFRQFAEQRGMLTAGEAIGCQIVFQTNQSVYALYKQMFSDGQVHSVVGSSAADHIFYAMMQECYCHWVQLDNERKDAEREKRRREAYETTSTTDSEPSPA
jgi:hypothetical protein